MQLQPMSADSGRLLNVKASTVLHFVFDFESYPIQSKLVFFVWLNSWSKSKSMTVLDVAFIIQCRFSIGSPGNSSLVHLQPRDSCPAPTLVVTGQLKPYQVGREWHP